MSKIKQWNYDRCGTPHTSYPWHVVALQTDPETGDPTQTEKLTQRYKDSTLRCLCKDCADKVVDMVMGPDDPKDAKTVFERIMACQNEDELAHYLCDLCPDCDECPVTRMCKADTGGKNGFYKLLKKGDRKKWTR